MNKQIKNLINYQEVDKKVKAIEDDFIKNEISQKALTANKFLKSASEKVAALEAKAKTVSNSYSQAMAKLEELKNTANEYLKTISTCENEEELNYCKKKFSAISDAVEACAVHAQEINKEMEGVLKEYGKLSAINKQMRADYDEYAPKFKELRAQRDSDLKPLKENLAEIAKEIDHAILQKYEAMRKDNKFPILFRVDTANKSCYCPACATGLSMGIVSELVSGSLKECESCRRLLYAEEK